MANEQISDGLWVKTRFYKEGDFMHAVTYCVADGSPEVMRFSVDLRPIEAAVKRYHDKLHNRNPDSHAAQLALANQDPEVAGIFDAIAAPFKSVAHAVDSVAKSTLVKAVTGAVAGVAKKITDSTKDITGITFAQKVLGGQRIDRALVDDIKRKIAVAPDIASVASIVPGLGTGIAGSVAFAAALAEGKPITEASIAAARNAVPGGPAVQFAFDIAANLARGQNITHAALEAARSRLPAQARAAFDFGYGVVQGQNIQRALGTAAKRLGPTLLGGLGGKAIDKFSPETLSAFATANHALETVSMARDALNAESKVRQAADFLSKANGVANQLGAANVARDLAQHPALADKIKLASVVTTAAKSIPQAAINEAKAAGAAMLSQVSELQKIAASDPDPQKRLDAQKSIRIMEIVAQQRQHVATVAAAHAGGTPGVYIDQAGRLTRGNFVRTQGPANGYLYAKDGGGQGSFSRVSTPNPAATAQAHARQAALHASEAVKHANEARKTPTKAPQLNAIAAHHATQAIAHKAAANAANVPRIGGPIVGASLPGFIGCNCS